MSERNAYNASVPYLIEHPWRDDAGYVVTVEIGPVRGRLACTGLTVRAAKPHKEVTTTVIRRLRVAELGHEAIDELLRNAIAAAEIEPGTLLNVGDVDEEFLRHRAEFWERTSREAEALRGKKEGSPGRRLGLDHYKAVARAYKEAQRSGRPRKPTAAIAERYGVPRNTAATWVRRARAHEFLPPSDPDRRGQADPYPRASRAPRRKP